jgi:hypothetical protein
MNRRARKYCKPNLALGAGVGQRSIDRQVVRWGIRLHVETLGRVHPFVRGAVAGRSEKWPATLFGPLSEAFCLCDGPPTLDHRALLC